MKKHLLPALLRITSLFLVALSSFCVSFSQTKFSAIASAKTLGKNDYLQVQFIVENGTNIERISPPSFKNFSVVSGPNQQSGMTNINGNVKQYVALDFTLKPQSTGKFSIPAATAIVNGKQYQSNALTVDVTNSPSSNSSGGTAYSTFGNITIDDPLEPQTKGYDDYILHKGENVEDKIKKNLFVKVDVNKTSCYVGEPIIASYKLYTRLKSESDLLKTPSFNGFSVSELGSPDNYSLSTEKYNGREYNVYTLRKVQLYALQAGSFELEPVEVENRVTFIKAEYAAEKKDDMFFDMLRDFADAATPPDAQETKTVTIKSRPLTVTVKPLPELNKPVDYKGAVGDFTVQALAEKNNLTTDDAGNFKIIISGSGNIQLINAPEIQWPQGLEGFAARSTENIDKLSVPMKGVKVFIYPFTIDSAGSYTIPPVNFSYFDINTSSYKTIKTTPVVIEVKKGKGNPKRSNVIQAAKKTSGGLGDILSNNKLVLLSGLFTLGAVILLLVANKKTKSRKPIPVKPVADAPVKKDQPLYHVDPLLPAQEKLAAEDPVVFYHALDGCIRKFLSSKLDLRYDELNKKRINERLDKCNVPIATSLLLNSLLENIEINLYAPVSSQIEMQNDYEKANEFVLLLNKQVC